MPNPTLMVPKNPSHNVLATIETAKTCLTDLAKLYLVTEVAGQSQATLDAKRRDLTRFLAFYQQLYGHDRPEEWFVSVTKAFLKQLRGQRLAQASLARIYATVRHFARWLHRKFPELFPLGCLTEGVKPPAEPSAHWKGLARRLSRREAAAIVRRIAGQANANRPAKEHIQVTPHVLRHTFLRKLAEEKGVHYAREASGHQSDRYIWRYVKPNQQTLAEAIEELE